MKCNRFKIQSYLRLAELCSTSETDKRREYMEIIEQLLNELNDEVLPKQPVCNESVTMFVKDCKDICFRIVNKATNKVYKEYHEYCIDNSLEPLVIGEFSKQVKKHLDLIIVDKKINGKKYRIFVES